MIKNVTIELRIDDKLLKKQYRFLVEEAESVTCPPEKHDAIEGILNLMEAIVDTCHDKYGMDTLLESE